MLKKLASLVAVLLDKGKPYRKFVVALLGVAASAAYLYLQNDGLSPADWKILGLEALAALGVYGVRNAPKEPAGDRVERPNHHEGEKMTKVSNVEITADGESVEVTSFEQSADGTLHIETPVKNFSLSLKPIDDAPPKA